MNREPWTLDPDLRRLHPPPPRAQRLPRHGVLSPELRGLGSGCRVQGPGSRVRGSGCGVQGAGFRVLGSGCRVQGVGFRVRGSGCRVQGAGFRVQGSGCRVQGSGCRVRGSGYDLSRSPSTGYLSVPRKSMCSQKCASPGICPNRPFQVLDLYRRRTKSRGVWYKSRQFKKTICSPSDG